MGSAQSALPRVDGCVIEESFLIGNDFWKANPSLAGEYGNFASEAQAISAVGSTDGDDVS